MEIDSNQELAMRAKAVAEKMMQLDDFVGAREFALRAQKLYANLENISQMLMVCEVHCASGQRLSDGEMDWFGILQVEQTADEVTIKQQYKKSLLRLHPGKNDFPGAEAAFEMVKRAKTVLLSKNKQPSPRCAGIENKDEPVPSHGSEGMTTNSTNCGSQDNHKSKVNPMHLQELQEAATAPATPPTNNSRRAAFPCRNGHFNKDCIGTLSVEDSKNDASQQEQRKWDKVNQGITTDSGSGYNHKSKGVNPPDLQELQEAAASTPAAPPTTNSKRAAFPWRNDDSNKDCIGKLSVENSEKDALQQERRKCDKVNGWMKRKGREIGIHVDYSKNDTTIKRPRRKLSSLADDAEDEKGPAEGLRNGCLQRHSEAKVNLQSVSSTDLNKNAEHYEYADPEFNDFDKDRQEGCFREGQIWAIYAEPEAMPRYYALIRNVSSSGFKLRITWLEPVMGNRNKRQRLGNSFPAVCGLFEHGESASLEGRILFSHLVHPEKGSCKSTYKIFPRRGEVWALFKNWNTARKTDRDAKRKYQYEIVEIVSEYNGTSGVRVAPLAKVKGFVSVFCRSGEGTGGTIQILPAQLTRFSHQVPSLKMSGKEREGLPTGCFEIDPASMPESICTP